MNALICNMLAILCARYYSSNNILDAFQNGIALPKNGQFIIVTELNTSAVSYPEQSFTGHLPSGTTSIDNIDVTNFQIDFYGINARLCCANTRTYMQSQDGTNYLAAQTPSVTVYNIHEMMQLTASLDQQKYLPRFAFKFSLFNNNAISYQQYGFNHATVGLIRVP